MLPKSTAVRWCLLITITIFTLRNQALGQTINPSLTFTKQTLTISELLKEIEQQTGLSPSFNSREIKKSQKVTIGTRTTTLSKVVDQLGTIGYKAIVTEHSLLIIKKTADGSVTNNQSGIYPINTQTTTDLPNDTTHDRLSITGFIFDHTGAPLPGASVFIAGTNHGTVADSKGTFRLDNVERNSTLLVSQVGFETEKRIIQSNAPIRITCQPSVSNLNEVNVVSTGFQKIPKDRANGSYEFLNNKQLRQRVSTNVLDKIDGNVSGVLFSNSDGQLSSISIRDRSTIFANSQPLVIVDNFPYEGDLNNLNPNDIENISILKDASAASIWGVRSGNGVIVITTKQGALNSKTKIDVNANVTFIGKPDLYYQPQLSSSDVVGVQEFLYNNGYYDGSLGTTYMANPGTAQILNDLKNGTITQDQANTQLNHLKTIDVRKDLQKYFYQEQINQQYAINIQGGGDNQKFFLSGGFDKNMYPSIYDNYKRFTLNANSSFYFLQKQLQLTSGIMFSNSSTVTNSNSYNPYQPYDEFISSNGTPLPIYNIYSKSFTDDPANAQLLDWNYYPLNDRRPNTEYNITDYKINLGLSYTFLKNFQASIQYQYQNERGDRSKDLNKQSFAARDLINQYTDLSTGTPVRNIPIGDILSTSNTLTTAQYGRLSLSYQKKIGEKHSINLLGGFEINKSEGSNVATQFYGYDPETGYSAQVQYLTPFTNLVNGATIQIPDATSHNFTVDHYRSFFFNGSYIYNRRYVLTASARKDESNLFGVKPNQKSVPLGSIGLGWVISSENFYHFSGLPYLKLRITDGYNGNVDKTLSAYVTAQNVANNIFGNQFSQVINPPNPSLRWEKVNIINAGVDFGTRENIVNGSIEVYQKNGTDLIGFSPIAPQTGIAQFKGNVNNLRTRGIDVTLNATPINKTFRWDIKYVFSYSRNIITKNLSHQSYNSDIVNGNFLNPLEGQSYSALFTYKSLGLDSAGNPKGILNGKPSEDYTSIVTSTNLSDITVKGQTTPLYYGGLRNSFTYKAVELSINITYKLGYNFRQPSLSYSNLYSGTYAQRDYEKRWQKPGDEKTTFVPSQVYPADPNRDNVYLLGERLVQRADYIRLQDIMISYNLRTGKRGSSSISNIRFYAYGRNLGILWRSNHLNIDPDYINSIPPNKSLSFGVSASF